MKLFLAFLFLMSSTTFAQNGLGQKDEPRCGEPCSVCPGGIKQCNNTQADNLNRNKKDISAAKSNHGNNAKSAAKKQ